MYSLLLAICLLDITAGICPSNQSNLNGSSCCQLCEPGSGVVGNCTRNQDTVCAPCQAGKTFSSQASSTEECKPCSTCPEHTYIKKVCNVTHDTQCECSTGFFYSTELQACMLCTLCPVGWGAVRPCSPTENSWCQRCPNNTYSHLISGTIGCVKCRTCARDQIMIQPCTDTQDTVCIAGKGYASRYEETRIDVIPIYCALLGAVVCGLCGFAIYKHCQRQRNKRLGARDNAMHEDVEYSKASGRDSGIVYDDSGIKTCYNQKQMAPLKVQNNKESLIPGLLSEISLSPVNPQTVNNGECRHHPSNGHQPNWNNQCQKYHMQMS
ncbi:tumor necrosis factor receptor superfamily member 16-like [Octopus vulgaris]|uniref:Tumor necrosis factor receptor superfamily member 16-like n=1 Tax=Octopus vulgaris TaxID=6645 RepID=A0AA36AS37_OCTVU|nr:tumor necrosis factor receptor superfamily member 16-like [Octopus vulgaris]